MGEMKQVKVDNWGAFFLQRLKHFFNRTDYCDLTLQFQDNAQLKVHRLVLNACTEYFELLERTCEMYEDCLIMPDDLQADVVVPIVNFMYTGQLEYQQDLLNKLYHTAQIMNMTVLTKLLDAHRSQPKSLQHKFSSYSRNTLIKPQPSTSQNKATPIRAKTPTIAPKLYENELVPHQSLKRKRQQLPARPTRYDIPEELEKEGFYDNYENSFEDISYESKPLMTHPKNSYVAKRSLYDEPSSSKRVQDFTNSLKRSKSNEVEFKRLKANQEPQLFNDPVNYDEDEDPFDKALETIGAHQAQTSTHRFDHVIEMEGAKVTIEAKAGNEKPIDHAKIISEVLKKYPHLVKNNKNIKLKIVNTPSKSEPKSVIGRVTTKKLTPSPGVKNIKRERDYTYESDLTDTKEMGKLISLGVENVKGPWLCLICGTPGKAVKFASYHKFRNHLVEYHNEIPPSNMCEFCGFKSGKRNNLLHHVYTKHGVPPPPSYNFPKCNQCSYIALTKAFLVKHKLTHCEIRKFVCNVCQMDFNNPAKLLQHIQQTGHKICPDRRSNLQCIYCLKTFLREHNLYAHLKSVHKAVARNDGIIDISDDEENDALIKSEPMHDDYEPGTEEEDEDLDENEDQYQINTESGDLEIKNKKSINSPNQKILNQSFSASTSLASSSLNKVHQAVKQINRNEPSTSTNVNDTIVVLNQNEYLLKGPSAELVPQNVESEYIISDMMESGQSQNNSVPFTEQELTQQISDSQVEGTQLIQEQQGLTDNTLAEKQLSVNQPYQIVVSSEQEYKALMAANPSILFQDGTDGKTMAVMSHGNVMETGNMQIDASQNTNMMIIPEDYPINVSQTLPVDSSNIVVVYSHNMEQHGIQYSEQLVTNQNGQSQQVITTINNNPIQTSMMIDQPIEQWQNQSHVTTLQQQGPLIAHMAIQSETVIESNQNESTHTTVDKGLTETTEIQIIGGPGDIMTEEVVSQSAEVLQNTVIVTRTDGVYQQVEHQMQSIQPTALINNHDQMIISEHQVVSSEMEKEIEGDNVLTEDIQEHEAIEEQIVEEEIEENTDNSLESESSQEFPENELSNVPVSTSVKETIKKLASEWSDEEISKIHDDTPKNYTDALMPPNTPIQNSEVEETIENIQQEMVNQITPSQSEKKIIITSDIILPSTAAIITKTKSISSEPVIQSAIVENASTIEPATNNKLSSLLHDWDDNDNTEENGSKTQEKQFSDPTENVTETTELMHQSSADELKDDKIKTVNKIISDWDDEEEKEE